MNQSLSFTVLVLYCKENKEETKNRDKGKEQRTAFLNIFDILKKLSMLDLFKLNISYE